MAGSESGGECLFLYTQGTWLTQFAREESVGHISRLPLRTADGHLGAQWHLPRKEVFPQSLLSIFCPTLQEVPGG